MVVRNEEKLPDTKIYSYTAQSHISQASNSALHVNPTEIAKMFMSQESPSLP